MRSTEMSLFVVGLLACQLNIHEANADDFPGLNRDVPGFNNLPFSIPNGDAHKCYNIMKELKPYRGGVSAIEDFLRIHTAQKAQRTAGYYFNVPLTDIYIYTPSTCLSSCPANIIVKTTYNIDQFKIKLRNNSYVEMAASRDNWVDVFGFTIYTHETSIYNNAGEFSYTISRKYGGAAADINTKYGITKEHQNSCAEI